MKREIISFKIFVVLFLLNTSVGSVTAQEWYKLTDTSFVNHFIGDEPDSDDFKWTGEDWANQVITQSDMLNITNFGRKYANINLEFTSQTINISNNPVVYFEAQCTDTVTMQMRLIDTDGGSSWGQFTVKFSDNPDFVTYEIPVNISWANLEKIKKLNFSRAGLETVDCDVQFRYLALGTTKYAELGQYKLEAHSTVGGTVELNPPGGMYESGTEVTLTAMADADYQFDGWIGAYSSTDSEILITMDSHKDITANFSPEGQSNSAPNYYVAQNHSDASDENPGTFELPFLTIQKAATVAQAGDTIFIREGTYRETISPVNSGTAIKPIVYMPFANEKVTISGTQVITGWSKHEGNIYKAPMAANFFESEVNMTDQVFVDGQMMNLARWPNTSLNLSYPVKAVTNKFISKTREGNVTTGVMEDEDIPPGDYAGAEIYMQPNNGAWSWTLTGNVQQVEDNIFTFTSFSNAGKDFGQDVYHSKSRYYFFNKLSLLDTAGEWFHDTQHELLYIWLPNNENPEDHLIEAKKRDYGFNLSKLSHIIIKGFEIFGCNITTDDVSGGDGKGYTADGTVRYPWRGQGSTAKSHHITIDGITCLYPSHSTDVSGHFFFQYGGHSGIVLSGENHTIQNSIIRYSFANAISLLGNNHRIYNNLIEDINYAACGYGAIGQSSTQAYDCEVAYNTIRRTGRSGIRLGIKNSDPHNIVARVHHNEISDFMLQDQDGGGIYHGHDGKFLRIDHNIIHDGKGFIVSGIYPDWGKNYIYDHNIIYNVWADFQFTHNYKQEGFNNMIVYNNTAVCTNNDGFQYGPFNFVVSGEQKGNHIKNNIGWLFTPPKASGYRFWSDSQTFDDQDMSNNLYDADPLFREYAVDFRLSENSPAIDAGQPMDTVVIEGVKIPPFNDPAEGQMDIGAYEYGIEPFRAGSTLDTVKGSQISIFAAGKEKTENIIVMIRSNPVKIFENLEGDFENANYQELTFFARGNITGDMLQIWFPKDNDKQAVRIDKVLIDGVEYQSEDVICSCTDESTEFLECDNGYFHYRRKPVFTLTVNAGHGTIEVEPSGNEFSGGTPVSITAVPDEGYKFVNWSGDAEGNENPLSLTINSNSTITALFTKITSVESQKMDEKRPFIFPNPAKNGFLKIHFPAKMSYPVSVSLSALSGQVIYMTQIFDDQQSVHLPDQLTEGVYVIRFVSDRTNMIRKIIIQ